MTKYIPCVYYWSLEMNVYNEHYYHLIVDVRTVFDERNYKIIQERVFGLIRDL